LCSTPVVIRSDGQQVGLLDLFGTVFARAGEVRLGEIAPIRGSAAVVDDDIYQRFGPGTIRAAKRPEWRRAVPPSEP
jgi:hypothetical protein